MELRKLRRLIMEKNKTTEVKYDAVNIMHTIAKMAEDLTPLLIATASSISDLIDSILEAKYKTKEIPSEVRTLYILAIREFCSASISVLLTDKSGLMDDSPSRVDVEEKMREMTNNPDFRKPFKVIDGGKNKQNDV